MLASLSQITAATDMRKANPMEAVGVVVSDAVELRVALAQKHTSIQLLPKVYLLGGNQLLVHHMNVSLLGYGSVIDAGRRS